MDERLLVLRGWLLVLLWVLVWLEHCGWRKGDRILETWVRSHRGFLAFIFLFPAFLLKLLFALIQFLQTKNLVWMWQSITQKFRLIILRIQLALVSVFCLDQFIFIGWRLFCWDYYSWLNLGWLLTPAIFHVWRRKKITANHCVLTYFLIAVSTWFESWILQPWKEAVLHRLTRHPDTALHVSLWVAIVLHEPMLFVYVDACSSLLDSNWIEGWLAVVVTVFK